jgi:signal transduction histidine kinase/ligand-binding sensor domain-containing protein
MGFYLAEVFTLPMKAQDWPFLFKHLTVEQGLSNDNIRIIYQDKMGFMWFGTDLGLNRYDGYTVTVYQFDQHDTNSISSNSITSILEDSHGELWIGTMGNGLCRFDRKKEVFIRYQNEDHNNRSLSHNMVRSIFEDSKKNLWIGTAGGGVNIYDRKSDSFRRLMGPPLGTAEIGSNFISWITEDQNGKLWFGTQVGILVGFDPDKGKGKVIELPGNFKKDITSSIFSKVLVDSDNEIWVCSEDGLFCYDQKIEKVRHFKKGADNKHLNAVGVTSILEYKKGIFMIATDHGGLNIYNKNTGQFSYVLSSKLDEISLSNNQLQYIYKAADDIIWIGNFRGGLNILSPKGIKFPQYKNLVDDAEKINSSQSVIALCEDPDANIWIGKDGQGIDIFNPKTSAVKHLRANGSKNSIPGDIITELHRDPEGNIWIGTYQSGLARYEWKTGKITYYRHDHGVPGSLGFDDVFAIFMDREGNLWVGTFGRGLDMMKKGSNKFRHFEADFSDSTKLVDRFIMDIFEDSAGRLWVATRNGLCLYDKGKDSFKRYLWGKGSGFVVYDICQDDRGRLWVGTDFALHLFHPETNTFESFKKQHNLQGTVVYGIANDTRGNIWISGNQGISCFHVSEQKFRNYQVSDGLQNREFTYTAALTSSDGRVYFGGKNGMNVFYPDSIRDNERIPPVYFTGLEVLNEPVRIHQDNPVLKEHIYFARKLVFNHTQNIFNIRFAALNYTNPENNQYAAMLEGFDKHWNQLGTRHDLTYTNLNPGRYTLRVIASNNDGKWNEEGIALEIVILPPWWKAWWFQIILYTSIASFLVFIYYLRVAFYRNQQKKLVKLVKDRTIQLEEVAVSLEEKQEEINSQNEELTAQRDELSSANLMLVEQKHMILEQNKELDKHRGHLESLVDQRTRELINAKDKAEESDRLKSSFLANLSHEIRTPLNAILGFSSLLGDQDLSKEERDRYNKIIHNSSNTLLDLISDILDISKIEASQLELDIREVSLGELFHELEDVFNMLMKRSDMGPLKPVHLRMAIPEEILKLHIRTDKLRLKQILTNLISNAIKFTYEGTVEVGCKKLIDSPMLEFYVKDTGIGIMEKHQKVIFDRFRKIEEDKGDLKRGTGLGLAISSQLVTILGGKIWVSSKPAEGAVFYFTLPFHPAPQSSYVASKEKGTLQIPDLEGVKIMVAEDDLSNYLYIERLLRKTHATILHALNGREVISKMQQMPDIKLILMDIKMPLMDGIESLKELRKMSIEVPVVAQTAYALADEVFRLKQEGFDEYIVKPIQVENLIEILQKFIRAT